jgi:hypothetical protein
VACREFGVKREKVGQGRALSESNGKEGRTRVRVGRVRRPKGERGPQPGHREEKSEIHGNRHKIKYAE